MISVTRSAVFGSPSLRNAAKYRKQQHFHQQPHFSGSTNASASVSRLSPTTPRSDPWSLDISYQIQCHSTTYESYSETVSTIPVTDCPSAPNAQCTLPLSYAVLSKSHHHIQKIIRFQKKYCRIRKRLSINNIMKILLTKNCFFREIYDNTTKKSLIL